MSKTVPIESYNKNYYAKNSFGLKRDNLYRLIQIQDKNTGIISLYFPINNVFVTLKTTHNLPTF